MPTQPITEELDNFIEWYSNKIQGVHPITKEQILKIEDKFIQSPN